MRRSKRQQTQPRVIMSLFYILLDYYSSYGFAWPASIVVSPKDGDSCWPAAHWKRRANRRKRLQLYITIFLLSQIAVFEARALFRINKQNYWWLWVIFHEIKVCSWTINLGASYWLLGKACITCTAEIPGISWKKNLFPMFLPHGKKNRLSCKLTKRRKKEMQDVIHTQK